jgi:hypothetical protein
MWPDCVEEYAMVKYWIHALKSCQLMPLRRPQMHRQGRMSWTFKVGVVSLVAVLFVFSEFFYMTKTSGVGNVEAQVSAVGRSKLAETYVIDPASFKLVTSAMPAIEVRDGGTIYTLTSSGTVSFNMLDSSTTTIQIDTNDIIIERPLAGAVTVVRDR